MTAPDARHSPPKHAPLEPGNGGFRHVLIDYRSNARVSVRPEPRSPMKVLALFTASESRGPVESQPAVQLRAGCGIVGDRHYRRNAKPAEQITLIESEAIADFNRDHQQRVEPHSLRRNVLTEGVDLNALEGREFLIGNIRLRGIELCEPCSVVGKLLAGDLTPPQVVKALLGRGGLRCEILSSGVVRVGDEIVTPED